MATTMVRKNFYITERQDKKLNEIAEKKGITFSEYVRRVLDEVIEKEEDNNDYSDY